jgi:3-oxoacyl-[acyl-carrier-protein] synthase-3
MQRSRIIGVGSYAPPQVVTNDDLCEMMNTSDEWIRQRTGIEQRFWADESTSTSDLALEAANRALENAGIDKSTLDLIIFATLSPDHSFPGSACFLQAKLQLPGVAALDIRQQCTGFIYGMSIADQFIRSGMYGRVLVVGAELHSKGLDKTPEGRDLGVLFGDGAGAVVMERCEVNDPAKDSHVLSSHLHADGRYAETLWAKTPGMANGAHWIDEGMIERGEHFPKMDGRRVYISAVKLMPEAILEALETNSLKVADVDLFLFHQANLRINEAIAHSLEVEPHRVFNTIQKYANTTAATLPIGMDEAVKAGVLKKGMLVACSAFGSGFTWGSVLLRW